MTQTHHPPTRHLTSLRPVVVVRALAAVSRLPVLLFVALVVLLSATATPATASGPAVSYRLPFPAGTSALVTQGNAGPFTHTHRSFAEFAWDFALPQGSMVSAAADGTVVRVEERYTVGGLDDLYRTKSNYVVLAHADGRYSVYMHLAPLGSLVSVGQKVRAGQGIALSGATGYASGPHLHFQVQESATVGRSRSVSISFADAGVPALGDRPVSGNVYLPPAPAPRAADPGFAFPEVATLPETLLTHQELTVTIDRAAGPPPPTPPSAIVPIRIVTADAAGRRTVRTSASVAMGDHLQTQVATGIAGPFACWAEYRDGTSWIVLGTAAGGLATLTSAAREHDVFIDAPGLLVEETTPGRFTATFTAVNLGKEPRLLRDLTVAVERDRAGAAPPAAGASPAPAGASPAPPVVENVYLRPAKSRTWRGTFTIEVPGRYTLTPSAIDSAGDPMVFPAARVGLPESATVTVEGDAPPPAAQSFADVPPSHPAYPAVEELAARGLVEGYPQPDGTRLFRPDSPITRAQFAKLLVTALGLPVGEGDICPFADVETSGPDGLFPDNYVAVAAAAGITHGTAVDPPRFSPHTSVTRSQVVTMIVRAAPHVSIGIPGDAYAPATRAEAAQAVAALLD